MFLNENRYPLSGLKGLADHFQHVIEALGWQSFHLLTGNGGTGPKKPPLKGLATVVILGIVLSMAHSQIPANAQSIGIKANVAVLPFDTEPPSQSYLGNAVEEILSGDLASLGIPIMDPAYFRNEGAKKSAAPGPNTEFTIKGTIKASPKGLAVDIGLFKRGTITPLLSRDIKAASKNELALKIQDISRQLADKIQTYVTNPLNTGTSAHGLDEAGSNQGTVHQEGLPETGDLLLAKIHPDKLLREPIKVPGTTPVGEPTKSAQAQPPGRPVTTNHGQHETITTGHDHTAKSIDEGEWTPDYPPEIEESHAKVAPGSKAAENQENGEEDTWTPDYPPGEQEVKGGGKAGVPRTPVITPVQEMHKQERRGWLGWLKAPWEKRAKSERQKTIIVTSRRELPFPPPVDIDSDTTGALAPASTTNSVTLSGNQHQPTPAKAIPASRQTAGKGGWFSWLRRPSSKKPVESPGTTVSGSKHATPSGYGVMGPGRESASQTSTNQDRQGPIWQWY